VDDMIVGVFNVVGNENGVWAMFGCGDRIFQNLVGEWSVKHNKNRFVRRTRP